MIAREAIEGFEIDNSLLSGKENGTVERNIMAIEALKVMDSHRWIPVEERLPAPNERVLMYRPCMEGAETGPVSVQWGWAYKDASHWMPVPNAPEN